MKFVAFRYKAIRIIPFSAHNLLVCSVKWEVWPSINKIFGVLILFSTIHGVNILTMNSKNV